MKLKRIVGLTLLLLPALFIFAHFENKGKGPSVYRDAVGAMAQVPADTERETVPDPKLSPASKKSSDKISPGLISGTPAEVEKVVREWAELQVTASPGLRYKIVRAGEGPFLLITSRSRTIEVSQYSAERIITYPSGDRPYHLGSVKFAEGFELIPNMLNEVAVGAERWMVIRGEGERYLVARLPEGNLKNCYIGICVPEVDKAVELLRQAARSAF